jgi:hypothetical protein
MLPISYIARKANGFVARNEIIPSTERVDMLRHNSVYYPENLAPSRDG